jgi:polygalacturonase
MFAATPALLLGLSNAAPFDLSLPKSSHDHQSFNVRDYGAVGDGKTDDTKAIQRAIDAALKVGGGVVHVPNAIYMINTAPPGPSGLSLGNGITLDFAPRAVFKAIPNAARNYTILGIRKSAHVRVQGGILIGDRAQHLGADGEWGHCLQISDGAYDIAIIGTQSRECWGDGFYIGRASNVVLYAVIADHNRRQGLSITAASYLKVINSTFSNTRGTKPESGIDIEPNANEKIYNLTIEGSRIFGNSGSGISDGVPANYTYTAMIGKVIIKDNFIYKNGANSLRPKPMSGIELTLVHGHKISGNIITENYGYGINLRYKANFNIIYNNIFINNLITPINISKSISNKILNNKIYP